MTRDQRTVTWTLAFGGVAVALVWGRGALEAGAPEQGGAPHGAAGMDVQQRQLAALLADQPAMPQKVDPVIWEEAVPDDNALTPERVALGRELYFETALSSDGTVSCATCHDVTRSFTDRRSVSEGVGGKTGKRNAPTTMNAALLHTQFLDGRVATLEDQAGQPILNPVEMAMPDRAAAIASLQKRPEYKTLFEKAYGRDINYDDLERAIAAFERTLMFLDAPFDRFVGGEATAISIDAQLGWELFNGKGRCAACHPINISNPLGTDNRIHNIGVAARHQDFEKLAREALVALEADPSERKLDELAVGTDLSELGRFMVTKSYADIGGFRTPQLRNVGITAPYMHDGSMETLWDTIDHYNKGGEANPFLDGGIEQLDLDENEVNQLVAFLFTLTDDRFASLNDEEMARQRALANEARPFRDPALASREVLVFERRALGKEKGATP